MKLLHHNHIIIWIYIEIFCLKNREINREVHENYHIYLYNVFILNSGFFNKSKKDWNEMSCNVVHVFLLIFIFNLTEENFEIVCQTCRQTVSRKENTISRKWKPNLQHGHRKVITCMKYVWERGISSLLLSVNHNARSRGISFRFSLTWRYVVWSHQSHLIEAILMSTHNIPF